MEDYYLICRLKVLADNSSDAEAKLGHIFMDLIKEGKITGYTIGKVESLEDVLDRQMSID